MDQKQLGKGSHGTVFRAKHNGEEVAIKKIDIRGSNNNALMEAAIMTSILHPNLSRARDIYFKDKKLCIVQDLAITDLARHCRGHCRPIQEVRRWATQLVHGLCFLHRLGFIHGDVKAANVLLYEDDHVRLTDFSLTVRKWPHQSMYSHEACTMTHRAPEIFYGQPWDEGVDIWALGCTIYEMAFGRSLFYPPKDCDHRAYILRAHRTWAAFRGDLPWATGHEDALPHSSLILAEYASLRDLLFVILRFNPMMRPKIADIVAHPFLLGPPLNGYICTPRSSAPSIDFTAYFADQPLSEPMMAAIRYAGLIFDQCADHDGTEYELVATCVWIASKLLIGNGMLVSGMDIETVNDLQEKICERMSFQLLFNL